MDEGMMVLVDQRMNVNLNKCEVYMLYVYAEVYMLKGWMK
jgi:hypothetical protein